MRSTELVTKRLKQKKLPFLGSFFHFSGFVINNQGFA